MTEPVRCSPSSVTPSGVTPFSASELSAPGFAGQRSASEALARAVRAASEQLTASGPTASGPTWVAASIPVPSGRAGRLLDLRLTEETVYFCGGAGSSSADSCASPDTDGQIIVGLGAAKRLRFVGDSRFSDAAKALPETFRQVKANEAELPCLRFFGGGAFHAGEEHRVAGCWAEFGDASFILPRITYADMGQNAQLIVLVQTGGEAAHVELAERLLSVLFEEEHENTTLFDSELVELSRRESVDAEKWSEMISSVRSHIASGEVHKIVAARRTTLHLSAEPQLSRVMQKLNEQAPLCTRFLLRLGEKTFLGATPERLVRKQGLQITTEALAGSVDASHSDAKAELLSSQKDRAEHEYVVRAIENVLKKRCEQISFALEPEVRSLRRILHLRTPMKGELKEPTSLLTLVDELHPTPAVGGVPQKKALRWILENESTSRGWYAAPFGWLDSNGNGEFVVALRSALIHKDRIHLYAGAGIVLQSDAQAEFEETALKLSGMVGALGLAG